MPPERFGRDVPPHERRPVPWYAPIGLRQIAQQQLWSTRLLHNLDRRETFTDRSAPFDLIDLRALVSEAAPDFWFDFVADTGDGGNGTYAVARGLLAPQLLAEGAEAPLPEGQLLILGGDLAYPAASPELYQSRLVEMFELARDVRSRFHELSADLPEQAPLRPHEKIVAAIPQNHDWLDSASTFCRYFVNDVKAGLIGARAPQTRTYFAIALPHDWFVLGLDFALTGDLDRAQYEAFARLIETGRIPAGAQLILVYPEPTWTRPFASLLRPAYPLRFQRLEHLCAAHGLHLRMRLAGDLHHYVRERLPSTPPGALSCDLVTCGSGGAFGHATHSREVTEPKVLQWASEPDAVPDELRGRVVLGRVPSRARAESMGLCASRGSASAAAGAACPSEADAVDRPVCYPDQATSRRQAWGNLSALLRRRGERCWQSNLAFALMLGAGLLAAGWLPGGALMAWDMTWAGLVQALLRQGVAVLGSPLSLAAHAALAFTALMLTTDNDPMRAGRPERLWGALLALLLMGLAAGLGQGLVDRWIAPWWPAPGRWSWAEPPLRLAQAVAQAAALGALAWAGATLAAGGLVGAFLLLLGRWGGRAVTNTSSALSLQGHKGFLRLRVHPGGLEAHMLGCDEPPQRWVVRPAGPPGEPPGPRWEPAPGAAPLRWRVVDRFTQQRPA